MHYGLPEKILSDQGRNFESSLISALCKVSKIKKLRTSPYRPQTYGQCKWFNATLIPMLGTLANDAKTKLARSYIYLGTCLQLHSLKCNGVQPILSDVHGRHLMLPIVIEFGVQTPDF